VTGADGAAILTLNAGSSSLKFSLFPSGSGTALARGQLESLGAAPRFVAKNEAGEKNHEENWANGEGPKHAGDALVVLLQWLKSAYPSINVEAVGHRVVHGGVDFAVPVLVDDAVFEKLKALEPLAPLHQPHNLSGVEGARKAFPGTPQIACFDTAFHRKHPFVNDVFALPRHFFQDGVRRYGFHGLSYEFIAGKLADMGIAGPDTRVIVAHLGNGASMCAIKGGQSVGSTMGFSALDGLPMGTRCGQIDPGVLLYLMDQRGMSAKEITNLLYKESGLLGLSGISHDMRTLEESDAPAARDAIDYFVFRIKREMGAMAAVLGGLDVIVFTGGIGENSRRIRQEVSTGLQWLGVELDEAANAAKNDLLSTSASKITVYRLSTDEEAMIAQHARTVVSTETPKKEALAPQA